MAAGPQAFYCLWQKNDILEKLFEELSNEDICNVRLASSACCNLVTKRLFLRTHLTFTANTFTKQSRISALSRIGHHIEHLTFYLPHSDDTFLPPLIHPETGREISFLYAPHTSMASVLARPKFANSELGDILTQQYPPLFHAASNVPSFINAMRNLPNMRHLTIKTPGQNPKERYRRDIVDYALISLRISLERAPLTKLSKLSLSSVHPSAFLYLRHVPGFGCLPSAGRRWQQIRKLNIACESWDFYGPSPGLDYLRIMDDFIRAFSQCLEKFTFTWLGRRGPCPVSLAADPLFAPPRSSRKLFHEVTSPMSPLPPAPAKKPIMFRNLRFLAVRNATMNAPQVADLVSIHQHCVREFDFENVALIRNGSWDEALAPLMDTSSRSDHWSRRSIGSVSEIGSMYSVPPREDIPSPSAAVHAVSQELHGLELSDGARYSQQDIEYADDLSSDIEDARKASILSFGSRLKKRRITKRRRRRKDHHEELEERQDESFSFSSFFHRHKKSKESLDNRSLEPRSVPVDPPMPDHYRSRSRLFGELDTSQAQRATQRLLGELASLHSTTSNSSHRLFGEISEPDLTHSSSPTDEAGSIDEYYRPTTPFAIPEEDEIDISAPILDTNPSMPTLLHPTVYDPTAELCNEISAVQRDLEAEENHRMLAEDAELRTSALRKAKEAVLTKLSEQFGGNGTRKAARREQQQRDQQLGIEPSGGGMAMSARFRDGLFGKSSTPAANAAAAAGNKPDRRSMDVPILFSRG